LREAAEGKVSILHVRISIALMRNLTYKVRLVRVDVPGERLERSRFLQEANIKYLDLVGSTGI
jgi:hypothetical protein